MRGRVFTMMSVISLLAGIATTALWIASRAVNVAYVFVRADGPWEFAARDGKLWLDNSPQNRLVSQQNALNVQQANARLPELRAEARRLEAEAKAAGQRIADAHDYDSYVALLNGAREADLAVIQHYHSMLVPPAVVPQTPYTGYSIPIVIPALASALLPFFWWRVRARNLARAEHNLCVACGYDLRATPSRCPECGASAATSNRLV